MKRCIRCIIPETAKGIRLDDAGLCQLCRKFTPPTPKGEEALRKLVARNISDGMQYNCVVPVSGGRDSAYALYYAKSILGLNPIAVHNDNDFETEIATSNLKDMTDKLSVPLVRISSSKHLAKKIVTAKFMMNAPFGPGLVVDQTCEACKYGFESASYNTAKRENIRLVIWGDSKEESTQSFHSLNHHIVPTKLQRIFSPEIFHLLAYKYYFNKMKQEYGHCSAKGLEEVHLYDYIEWDRHLIVETIQREMCWNKPQDSATSWRIDCDLVPVVNYLTQIAYGVSKIELGFSNFIRNGKMDRQEALDQAASIGKSFSHNELAQALRRLGISSNYIDKILSQQ